MRATMAGCARAPLFPVGESHTCSTHDAGCAATGRLAHAGIGLVRLLT